MRRKMVFLSLVWVAALSIAVTIYAMWPRLPWSEAEIAFAFWVRQYSLCSPHANSLAARSDRLLPCFPAAAIQDIAEHGLDR
jgi:hypothetical protein